jgi:hypothetical protein
MPLLLALVLLFTQGNNPSTSGTDLTLQGTITITDTSRALLPGVYLSLVHDGRFSLASTNEAGSYSFTGLTPGEYRIEASLPGFLKTSKTIDLSVSTTVNIEMSIMPSFSCPGHPSCWLPPDPIPSEFRSQISHLPEWLPVHGKLISGTGPAAGWIPIRESDVGHYRLDFLAESVSQVAEYYREVMKRHGLIIESESPLTEASYSFRARTIDKAHQITLEVRESSAPRTSRVVLTDTWALPKN